MRIAVALVTLAIQFRETTEGAKSRLIAVLEEPDSIAYLDMTRREKHHVYYFRKQYQPTNLPQVAILKEEELIFFAEPAPTSKSRQGSQN